MLFSRQLLAVSGLFSLILTTNQALALPRNLILSENPELTFLLVDKKDCNVSIYRGYPKWEIVSSYSCTTGKVQGDKFEEGDLKTPTGIYRFTDVWSKKDLVGVYGVEEAKPYGAGAFPLNYPNLMDRLFYEKTGYGIWLHGTEGDQPIATEGCVSVSNENFLEIAQYVQISNTLVLIDEAVKNLEEYQHIAEVERLRNFVLNWIDAWEDPVFESYLNYYSSKFANKDFDKKRWLHYKKRINLRNKSRDIQASNLTFLYSKGTYLVHFLQRYSSLDFSDLGWKTLYLEFQEDVQDFRIISENWEPYESLADIPKTANASNSENDEI
jgi:murein L,D-transpeptidase YafK